MQHVRQFETKTASFTLTQADSGKVFLINATDVVATLPALSALEGGDGCYFTFIVETPSATTGFSISPNSADAINNGTDDKDLINSAATDAAGDGVSIIGGGDDTASWWTYGKVGTWAAEA